MNDDLLCTIYWPMPDHPRGEQEVLIRIPLRPLFAAVAMNGLLSADMANLWARPDDAASAACNYADALLKRLDKKPEAGEAQNDD